MMKLHDYLPSQNAYKVRLLLHHLDINHETLLVSIFEGAGQTDAFRATNPVGAVPVLELDDGRCLPESNAILMYLAEGTRYLPEDAWQRAQVARWMFFEADLVQNGIASLRHWVMTGKLARRSREAIDGKRALGLKTLAILDDWLAERSFLVDDSYTVADMSLYAYVGVADEADLPLEDYPHVVAWIARIRAQPGFLATVHPYAIDPFSGNELP